MGHRANLVVVEDGRASVRYDHWAAHDLSSHLVLGPEYTLPSSAHEVLVELFRRRPSLAAELLVGMFGVELPAYGQVRLEPGDCVDLAPTEYRADAVVLLSDDCGPVRAVVVEVQLRRNDDKRWTWLVYLATLRARLRCGATLLVVCVDQTTARWAATPIETGHPGWVLVPLVVGPDRVPVLDDPVAAAEVPELAVLSALAHGRDPARAAVLDALAGALGAVETEQALAVPSTRARRAARGGAYPSGGTDDDRNVRVSERVHRATAQRRRSSGPGRGEGRRCTAGAARPRHSGTR